MRIEQKNYSVLKLISFISYLFAMSIGALIFSIVFILILGTNNQTLLITLTNFSVYLVLLLTFLILLFFYYKRELHKFKYDFVKIILIAIGGWFLSIALNSIINIIFAYYNIKDTSQNQQIIEEAFKYPLFMIFVTVIAAPIVEETVFRGVIFSFFKNLKLPLKLNVILAFLVSATSFGLIHVIGGGTQELLLGIPYIAMGFVLCLVYYLTDNLIAPIITHFIQNFLATIAILLMNYFHLFPKETVETAFRVFLKLLFKH